MISEKFCEKCNIQKFVDLNGEYCPICRFNSVGLSTKDDDYLINIELKDQNSPSLLDKTKNFVGAVSRFAMSGFETVDSETKNSRLEICNSCDRMNKENRTCLECGCFLDIKTGWATEKCPIGKWDTVVQIQKPGGCGGCSQKKSE